MYARATFGKRKSPAETPPLPTESPPPPLAKTPHKVVIPFLEAVTVPSLQRLAFHSAAAAAGGVDEILLLIASPGGLLLPMLELYQTLIKLPVTLKTHAVGPVASAATLLMLAGSERSASASASFLFHQVSSTEDAPMGSPLARSVERHRQLYELTLHEAYRTRTQLPHEMIAQFASGEIVLDAVAAQRFGVVHRIDDSLTAAEASETPRSAA